MNISRSAYNILFFYKNSCQKVSLDTLIFFFFVRQSEFENFLLCERILINVTTCQNETSARGPLKRSCQKGPIYARTH
jgi:hypothetical protein